MRKDAIVLLAVLLVGCQSYEMRRQQRISDLQANETRHTQPKAPAPLPAPVQVQATAPPQPTPLAPPSPILQVKATDPPVNPPAPVEQAPAGNVEQAEPAVGQSTDKLTQLHQQAAARYAGMDSYIARLKRVEEVNGKVRPEELILFKFRKEPWSVYFKWIGPEGKGREATYVKGRHDDKLYTMVAAGDSLFIPAGRVIGLDPFGTLVRSNSRHTINEAGIGAMIDRYGKLVQNQPSSLSYQGQVRKPEYANPLEEVLQTINAGQDPLLAKGGSRRWYFDSQTSLPVMLMTWNAERQLVELYAYDQFLYPVKLDDNDFDPNVIWKKKD